MLDITFVSIIGFWYIKKYGIGEFRWQKHTAIFTIASLLLIFCIIYLNDCFFSSRNIFHYNFFTIKIGYVNSISFLHDAPSCVLISRTFDICIFGPMLETICYLGLLQKPLYKKMNPYHAIFITAVIFSFLHFDISRIPSAFTLGVIFGYLYYKTDKLIYPILCHSFSNIIVIFSTHYAELNTISTLTFLIIVTCFVVSLRYVIRCKIKNETEISQDSLYTNEDNNTIQKNTEV
ncbi:MAG: CPBP family intramembrane metalloprotease [Prevotellaceae bacterium]|nr:CPBP family intramembrane metalloprotease [Prevotellaceae bacterium]